MTARKPISEDVAKATAKLKDSQRALTDFRRQLLERGHVPITEVEATLLQLAYICRKHVLDLPVKLLKEFTAAHPDMFTDRKTAVAIEDALERATDSLLADIAAEQWTIDASSSLITPTRVFTSKPTGRPKRPKVSPEVRAP